MVEIGVMSVYVLLANLREVHLLALMRCERVTVIVDSGIQIVQVVAVAVVVVMVMWGWWW